MSTGPLRPPGVGEAGEALAPIAPLHLAWPGHFDRTDDVEAAWALALAARPAADRHTLERADVCGRERHGTQTRRGSDTPYWVHPLRVAMTLMQWGITDRDLLVAALLHDTVEDTLTTPDEIRARFGIRPSELVVWLTAPEGRMRDSTREYYRRLLAQGPPRMRTSSRSQIGRTTCAVFRRWCCELVTGIVAGRVVISSARAGRCCRLPRVPPRRRASPSWPPWPISPRWWSRSQGRRRPIGASPIHNATVTRSPPCPRWMHRR